MARSPVFFSLAEPVSPHLLQKCSDFCGVTSYRDYRINAALWTHRCLPLTLVVVIHPFIDGRWRIYLTAMKASAQFSSKELAAVNATSLVRGYMILGVGDFNGVHFSGEQASSY